MIATDVAGTVTYLNTAAEAVTGWSEPEAIGQPLETVFRIVIETTRERVANPAERALRDGVVVGLANHTALIRRDGNGMLDRRQRRADQGRSGVKCRACVLIFRDVTAQRADRAARSRANC